MFWQQQHISFIQFPTCITYDSIHMIQSDKKAVVLLLVNVILL